MFATVVILAATCAAQEDEREPAPPFVTYEFDPYEEQNDGFLPKRPDFAQAWLAYGYLLLAGGLIMAPAFKG
ncbi:MAG: hypothetical protein ACYTFO_09510, partial [Planctomycetota bacterium]